MICERCKIEFDEKDIQESHDVPCYLFEGNRQGQKNQADKFRRRWLCERCHKEYEKALRIWLQQQASKFGGDGIYDCI